jgi:hypothetical protein
MWLSTRMQRYSTFDKKILPLPPLLKGDVGGWGKREMLSDGVIGD